MKKNTLRISLTGMLALLLTASCVTENAPVEDILVAGPDIRATQEGDKATRTTLTTDAEGAGTIYWLPNERINVFFNRQGVLYTSTNEDNATKTVFRTEDVVDYASIHEKNIWGLYPYDSEAECDGAGVTTTIPASQKAVPGTFDTDLFPLLAHSASTDLVFYNVCGGIKFSLTRDDIYKITFRGNADEGLAGKVKLSMSSEGRPAAQLVGAEKTLVLTPLEGTTFKKDKDYYLVCLPTALSQGFEMTFYSVAGKKATYKRSDAVTLKRAIFTRKAHIDENATVWEDNPEMTGGKRSGLYLGITGFNQELYNYPITRLNDVSLSGFNSFVNGLPMKNGTLLCYGVDQSISRLQEAIFPDDLCAVALVTFTDGLDQGSVMMNPAFSSDEQYLKAIQDRILYEKVAGHPIMAYSVGLKGSDVSDVNKFRANLQKLASPGNAFEVNSMSEVNSRLQQIATNVTDISYLYDIALRIPGQSDGTRIRFTFDSVSDASQSSVYIEGTFRLSDYSLREVSYRGLTTESGGVIRGTAEGIFVTYSFGKVRRLDESAIQPANIKQWNYVTSTGKWQVNSEFDANQNVDVEVTKRSVAVMLVLDCSSSLGSQFSTMQSHARSFIRSLQQASYDPYAVSSVSLNATSLSPTVKSMTQLVARVTPDTARDKSVTWTSSDPAVATVDQEGKVYALAPGTAVIVVTTTDGGYTASCTVTVKPVYVTQITLDKQNISLQKGKTAQIQATFLPEGATIKAADWTSDNEAVATVDQTGLVTAVGPGETTIRATASDGGGRTASCAVSCWDAPELVDLGLSVKWGSLNIGASAPEKYGDYFAWGETETKTAFSWSNYKWCKDGSSSSMTKYNTNSSYGTVVDGKTVLEAQDDAAAVLLGGAWRMPTKEEYDELLNTENCTWTWTTQNGVQGYKVTSRKEGFTDKSIFLPVSGYKNGTSRNYTGNGYIWTSSLQTDGSNSSWRLYTTSSNRTTGTMNRYYGLPVRPVSSVPVTAIAFNPAQITLKAGEKTTLTPVFSPRQPVSYQLNWSSSDARVVKVDSDGTIHARKAGTAIVTATLPNSTLKASCTVKVEAWGDTEVVDLGLSVKWATINIGATAPEDYGDYFAWGETDPKTNYSWSNYKWSADGSSSNLTKYNASDGKAALESQDDIAATVLGGTWRMPTREEFNELNNTSNCTWSWTTQNGVRGYKVTSRKTGFTDKSIFLPAAGYREGANLNSAASYGYYWTSSLNGSSLSTAYRLQGYSSSHNMGSTNRYLGYAVRPVMAFSGTAMTFDPAEMFLNVGSSTTLSPVFTPRAPLTYTLKWTSSDEKVATVSSSGVVKGIGQGKATITAALEGTSVTASCTVTVIQMVTGITLSPSSLSLRKGGSQNLTATLTPADATIKTLTWASDDETVATVSQAGRVTAVGIGTVTVRATANDGSGRTASCQVTCWDAPELVDLGLSVNWGSWNLGASAPEAYGDYFAWGEVEPKTSFNWSNYKWSNNGSSSSFTKYNVNSSYGTVDGKKVLEAQDDAAAVLLGGAWRMPTKEEYDELLNTENCTWTWTTQNGVQGYKVTSRKTGYTDKSIFLPVSGYKNGTTRNNTANGYIWTSSLYPDGPYSAWRLYTTSSNRSTGTMNRYYGMPVRPVSSVPVTSISLQPSQLSLKSGESATLKPVFSPRQPLSYTLTWSSSDEKVATVSAEGVVRARKAGSATVTATLPNSSLKATCTVKVETWGETEVVDLGLSVQWATVNIGASEPEDYGDYFAWGETEPKLNYNWATYRWSENGSSSSFTKYNASDGKIFLESQDDAAAALLGGTWRTPTREEIEELNNTGNCSWSWTTQNGVRGYKVTSRKAGFTDKSIFLPAAGYMDGSSVTSSTSNVYYWTSTLNGSYLYSAFRLYGYSSSHSVGSSNRYQGYTVRPVKEIALTKFVLDTPEATLNVGASRTLALTAEPRTPAAVVWTSSNPEVATVSAGTVKAVAPGKTTITAATPGGDYKATCVVSVIQPVSSVVLNKMSILVKEGGKETLTATVSPENATDKSLTWTSTNEAIVKVDKNGTVTGVAKGKAAVWASANDGSGVHAECTVWVCRDEPVATPELVDLGLSVKWASFNLGAIAPEGYGDYYAWGEIYGYNEGKETFDWSSYSWSRGSSSTMLKYNATDNKTVLDMEDDVARVKLGGSWRMPTRAELDELLNSSNCTWNWTTQNGVRGYKVTSRREGFTDQSIFLPAAGNRNGTSLSGTSSYLYLWSSSLYPYTPSFTYNLYGYSSSRSVNTNSRYLGYPVRPVVGIPLTSIAISSEAVVNMGSNITLTPTYTPRQPAEVRWTSSDTGVASVDANGVVRGVSLGTATITVSTVDGAKKASCKVTVVQPVTNLSMVYTQAGVPVGASRQLAVNIGPENAYNKDVTWTSSNTDVATVDANGTVTGVSKGSTTIRATAKDGSGRSATCNLTVYNNVAVSTPEAVDLGLSVKWASFNLGASTPEDYGDFYGWGEIFGYNDGKTNFNWSTYQWSNGNSYPLTRYNTNTNNGTVDDKTVLEAGDDAACFKLGGKWRMPTEAEFAELRNLNNCSWTWTTRSEKTGYLVTSKKNGNSIFLPVGGYRSSSSTYNTTVGYYWTSTLASGSPVQAYSVDLSASGLEPKTHDRQQGQAIRAVTP